MWQKARVVKAASPFFGQAGRPVWVRADRRWLPSGLLISNVIDPYGFELPLEPGSVALLDEFSDDVPRVKLSDWDATLAH